MSRFACAIFRRKRKREKKEKKERKEERERKRERELFLRDARNDVCAYQGREKREKRRSEREREREKNVCVRAIPVRGAQAA